MVNDITFYCVNCLSIWLCHNLVWYKFIAHLLVVTAEWTPLREVYTSLYIEIHVAAIHFKAYLTCDISLTWIFWLVIVWNDNLVTSTLFNAQINEAAFHLHVKKGRKLNSCLICNYILYIQITFKLWACGGRISRTPFEFKFGAQV